MKLHTHIVEIQLKRINSNTSKIRQKRKHTCTKNQIREKLKRENERDKKRKITKKPHIAKAKKKKQNPMN